MLDLIVTHYKEPWEVCRKQFLMLDLQRCVDWSKIHVTAINDGGHRLPEDRLNELSFEVEQLDIPHGGVSAARNAGIEHATREWIMFCDCDDTFENIYALRDVQNVLRNPDTAKRFDLLWSHCLQEDFVNGSRILANMKQEKIFVFCHGKLYRRQFLLDEGIRFDTQLTFNEDSCFNAVIIARTPHTRIGEINSHAPVYAWIRRENSVTLGDNANDDGAYGQMKRNLTVTEENRLHRAHDNYTGMVTRTAYDAYYILNGKRVSTKGKRRIAEFFIPWMKERKNDFGKVSPDILKKIRDVSRMELLDAGERLPDSPETVRSWINMITEVAM